MNETYNDWYQRKTTCTFLYIQKVLKNPNLFICQKLVTWQKERQFTLQFYKTDTYRYTIFMIFLKSLFIYKKHDTMRSVTFYYTEMQKFRKKQDNLRYIFIYKKMDTLCHAIFHGNLKLAEGGVTFLFAKTNAHCVKFIYAKKCPFRYLFIYKMPYTLS